MTLNENYMLRPDDISTFRFQPQKKKLISGTSLYRFVTLGQNYILGPYWLDQQSVQRMRDFAGSNNQAFVGIARSWSAVKHEWNIRMDHLAEIRLISDCYAWEGSAKFQSITGESNVLFMGNSNQLFLPNLTDKEAKISSLINLIN